MLSRSQLLEELAWRKRPREAIFRELRSYGFDSDVVHFVMPAEAIVEMIDARLTDRISEQELVEWAECFEWRDDVGYPEGRAEALSDVVFCLANPEINYPLTEVNLRMLKAKCEPRKNA